MRVGIVGVGSMGSTHAAAWAETEAQIGGFVDIPPRARAIAEQYRATAYPGFDAMLADVDVVDICIPTHLHHEMVLKAAAAGKDIVCEKPLSRTVAQGQEMIAVCKAAGVKLLVAHVVRFFPEYARAKVAVDREEIGQPAVLRLARETFQPKKAANNWFLDPAKSGGMILDLMIHDFDYARWIAGEVKTVFAKSINSTQPDAPDHGLVILTHQSGAISHVTGSWAYPPPTFRTRFEIAGSGGLIEFDSASSTPISLYLHKQKDDDAPDVPLPTSPLSESPYTTEIKAFYNALAHDAPVPVSAEDGLAAVQIALAATESTHSGASINLEPLPELSL